MNNNYGIGSNDAPIDGAISGSNSGGDAASSAEANSTSSFFLDPSKSKHPKVGTFHLLFKALPLFIYLFSSWFTDDSVVVFIILTCLFAADFWTVKNISGRFLVGLQWRNGVDATGQSKWIFESKPDRKETISHMDARIFYFGLYLPPVFWVLFALSALLQLNIMGFLICTIGLVLFGANIYGYIKCDSESQKQLTSFADAYLLTQNLRKVAGQSNPV